MLNEKLKFTSECPEIVWNQIFIDRLWVVTNVDQEGTGDVEVEGEG